MARISGFGVYFSNHFYDFSGYWLQYCSYCQVRFIAIQTDYPLLWLCVGVASFLCGLLNCCVGVTCFTAVTQSLWMASKMRATTWGNFSKLLKPLLKTFYHTCFYNSSTSKQLVRQWVWSLVWPKLCYFLVRHSFIYIVSNHANSCLKMIYIVK